MSFGIIIVCSPKDFSLAKGCLASVHYFIPGVLTCLLIDGEVDTTEVEKLYQCRVIRRKDIKDPFLKENSFGWGITKMNAFWESPFERFVLLDADICVWGNVLENLDLDKFDMIIDQPQYRYDEEAINKWFFDTARLSAIDPGFNPQDYSNNYFCTGVFYSRKGVFDLSWYQELFELSKKDPDLFKFGEMGMLNYMIFKSVAEGKLRVKNQYIQHICPDFDYAESARLFPFRNGLPEVTTPMVIHYNGNRKPYQKNRISYHLPMTFFRKKFYREACPALTIAEVETRLSSEDKLFEPKITLKQKAKNILRPFVKPLLGR